MTTTPVEARSKSEPLDNPAVFVFFVINDVNTIDVGEVVKESAHPGYLLPPQRVFGYADMSKLMVALPYTPGIVHVQTDGPPVQSAHPETPPGLTE